MFCACPRYLNVIRLRHDAIATLVLHAALRALGVNGARPGRYEVLRERSLGSIAASGIDPEHEALRPDAFLIDHSEKTVTPIEFSVPDDARLATAPAAQHAQYSATLRRAVPRLAAATSFRPLVVVVLGAWGTVHPSTISALVRLGIPPDAVTAVLRKAVKILARHAMIISRCRFAAARRGMPTDT